ncbi:efflux RND transporter permease subunit [Luteolibacter sp. AS25]|uniref:efflux RND transporter permease subunit n=1 Tax=Luteolibacter sp. AS25 TaxID=3135776 RepID=UPI00398A97E6
MNAIKWFTRNHVAGNFMMLVVLLAGFATWFKLKKEIFPEVSIDAVAVRIPYPNATPEEAERGVVIPVEEAIADLQGIKKIRGTAAQNVGSVMVEVETGYDVRNVMSDVKSRVDAIENFPEEAETPVLEEILIKAPVMSVTLTADTDEATLRKLAERVRDDLLTYEAPKANSMGTVFGRMFGGTPKISQVEIAGTRPYEISIEVSEERLEKLGLRLSDIAQAVRSSTLDLPGGSVRTERGEVILRALGKRYEASEMGNIPVATMADGSAVLLGDVADLIDGFEDVDLSSRFDEENSVLINVFRVGNEDTLALAELVRTYVKDSKERLPEGVTLSIWNDQSVYLIGRLDLLKRNAITGLILVLAVLTLFLRPSLAFLVALGIPVSFAGGIWLMPYMGISVNMISLFAFILVLGIVVDDAIVTGENVYTRIQKGEHPSIAAWKGTSEVGTIVVFGVLTTMVAFTPMLGLSGVSGKIWPNIPLVVIPTLAFSLLQSKFVLPAHLALLSPRDRSEKARSRFFLKRALDGLFALQRTIADGLETFVEKVYQPALRFSLKWRYVTAAVFIAVLVLTLATVATGLIKAQFMPEVEGDILSAKVELSQGVPFAETEKAVKRIEDAALVLSEKYKTNTGDNIIKHVLSSSGTQPFLTTMAPGGAPVATHLGEVTIELAAANDRSVGSEQLVAEWRALVGTIPGVVELSIQAETATGGNAIDVNLTGPNLDRLVEATAFAKDGLENFSGVIDISDSNRAGKDELRFKELTPAGRALGLRLEDVALQVRDAFYGNEVQRLQRGRDEVKVMVRFPREDRRTLDSLETMNIRTPEGDEVPLLQVVTLEPGRGPAVIERTDRQRSVKITADVEAGVNANVVVGGFTEKILEQIPMKFPGVRYSFEGEQKDQNDSVREIGMGFLAALVGMYVLIAIPLRSYLQPLIIMSVIPFGLVGAIWGHALLGMNLSIMSMCGLVALAGVVVNDSLVMVDYVNRHREESDSLHDAAVAAGGRRFRAILLTSLTTFVGIMPMILETDMQAKFLIPMAVSLAFGILFATVITLFLVPGIYLILEDIKMLGSRKKRLG